MIRVETTHPLAGFRFTSHIAPRELMRPAGRDFDALFGEFGCDFAVFYLIRLRVANVLQPHKRHTRISSEFLTCVPLVWTGLGTARWSATARARVRVRVTLLVTTSCTNSVVYLHLPEQRKVAKNRGGGGQKKVPLKTSKRTLMELRRLFGNSDGPIWLQCSSKEPETTCVNTPNDLRKHHF